MSSGIRVSSNPETKAAKRSRLLLYRMTEARFPQLSRSAADGDWLFDGTFNEPRPVPDT
jgi:hypothetical protein